MACSISGAPTRLTRTAQVKYSAETTIQCHQNLQTSSHRDVYYREMPGMTPDFSCMDPSRPISYHSRFAQLYRQMQLHTTDGLKPNPSHSPKQNTCEACKIKCKKSTKTFSGGHHIHEKKNASPLAAYAPHSLRLRGRRCVKEAVRKHGPPDASLEC